MLIARLSGLRMLAAACGSLAIAFATPASAGDRVDARFEIYGFAGLHVLTNFTSTQETPTGYSIAMDLDTRGFASAFVNLWSHSEVQGTLAGEVPRPEAYRAEVRRNGTDRRYGLIYRNGGSVIDANVSPAAASAYLNGVPIGGTVDQLTAYFLVERQLARGHSCALDVPVFDGSELYRLRFTDVDQETLAPDSHQSFAGPTKVCDVVRQVIVANPDKQEGTYEHGKIWYASLLPGRPMLPVRMEYDTIFGEVEGYLAELTGGATHLQLAGN